MPLRVGLDLVAVSTVVEPLRGSTEIAVSLTHEGEFATVGVVLL